MMALLTLRKIGKKNKYIFPRIKVHFCMCILWLYKPSEKGCVGLHIYARCVCGFDIEALKIRVCGG